MSKFSRRVRHYPDLENRVQDLGKRSRQSEDDNLKAVNDIERYRHIKSVNLNELQRSEILRTSAQPPANIGINIDLNVKVKFISFLPDQFFTPGCHVRPVFFVNSFDRPALITYNVEHHQEMSSNGEILYMITVEADLPYNLREDIKIFYFYKLETYENGHYEYKIENLLNEENHIRFFYPLARLVTSKNTRTITVPKSAFNEIDGLLLFDYEIKKLTNEKLKRYKTILVERLVNFNFLTNETTADEFKQTLNFIINCHASLTSKDSDYTSIFDKILCQKFENVLLNIRSTTHLLQDLNYLGLLAIFYLSNALKLTKNFSQEIFLMHNNNRDRYLKFLKDYFHFEYEDQSLIEFLKKYLEINNRDIGFNALIAFYHLRNSEDKFKTNLIFLKKDSILRFMLKDVENLTQTVLSFAIHYENLILNDPIIGALLLNYFNPNLIQIEDLVKSHSLPYECFIYFIGFKVLNDKHDEFERRFANKEISISFRVIKKKIIESIESEKTEKSSIRLLKVYNACSSLLNLVINEYSKEDDTIIDLIDLISNIHKQMPFFNIDLEINSELNATIRDYNSTLNRYLMEWFKKEFNQSLLISFGMKKISLEERENNSLLINIYRNFSEYHSDPSKFIMPKIRLEKFETIQDVYSLITYFGLDNQQRILVKLMNLKTVDGIVKDLFKNQIRSKISRNLVECLYFLVEFDFSQLTIYRDEFYEMCQSLIGEYLVKEKSENSIYMLCTTLQKKKYQSHLDFFMNLIMKEIWPKNRQVEFAVEKPYFLKFLEIIASYKPNEHSNPFNLRHINDLFEDMLQKYKALMNNFIQSEIGLGHVNLINLNIANIIKINKMIIAISSENFTLNGKNENLFVNLVEMRVKEKQYFNIYRKNLEKFEKIGRKFSKFVPKIRVIKDKLAHLDRLGENEIILNKVCETIKFDQVRHHASYEPVVNYFDQVNPILMAQIDRIISLDRNNCVLFDFLFQKSSESVNEGDLYTLLKTTLDLTFDELNKLVSKIDSGIMLLHHFDELINKVYQMNNSQFLKEMKYLTEYFNIRAKDFRYKQIYLYVEFKKSYQAALKINKIRQDIGLENEFNELDDVLSVTKESYEKWDLSKMDENIERTINVLTRVNHQDKLECLAAFTESYDLVKWLRMNAGNLSELKFLVDLASMSSSNEHPSYDRTLFAKALREAGNAYASLIYELHSKVNFFEFMDLCEKVCSHLESDKNIARKLLEVKDKVNLLDEIKRMRGNVELNSIKQAKLINESGIYLIGQKKHDIEEKYLVTFDQKNFLDDIIHVQVENKIVSFGELKELQNILMLIVPRKSSTEDDETDTLEFFIQFLSGVIRLAESYLNLKENSCIFFDDFLVKIYANFSRKSHVPTILFETKTNALSYTNPEYNSLDSLVKLCTLINETEEQWSNFVSKKRDSYPSLNYFTLKQLNILIKAFELIGQNKLLTNSDFEMIQSMMWNLNKNLDVAKIKFALEKSLDFMAELENFESKNLDGLDLLFKKEWYVFLTNQSSVNTHSITLTHLALIIQELTETTNVANRKLPGYLTFKNEPNLISCPQSELISIILSVYALTPDEPLPTNDEILFCQPETTSEQVENFLRLSFCHFNNSKIYTLVNIHNLSYTVANKTEKFIKNYLLKPSQFNLLFTCDSGKEAQSILASVYLKNRVRYVLFEEVDIRKYINNNLFTNQHALLSRGNFDPDNSSVRVIMSRKSGNGKSTYVKYLTRRVQNKYGDYFNYKIIRIKSSKLSLNAEIEKLLNYKKELDENKRLDATTIYHIDIAFEVFKNVDCYLFSLILSCYLAHSNGFVWRRNQNKDYFIIEITPPIYMNNDRCVHSMIDFVPRTELLTPDRYFYMLKNEADLRIENQIIGLDRIFTSMHKKLEFQRVCFYLKLLEDYRVKTARFNKQDNESFLANNEVRDEEAETLACRLFDPKKDGNRSELECLKILLEVFDKVKPNWHEIRNYVKFLNSQLELYEKSEVFCLFNQFQKDIRIVCLGLISVVAGNFGLPSLKCSETTESELNLDSYEISESRRWENLVHPFMILDSSNKKITFIGTHCDRVTKCFINPNTGEPIATSSSNFFIPKISHKFLVELLNQRIPIYDNFNEMIFDKQIEKLANLMNLNFSELSEMFEDNKYQLALDNCLKMIAIYLRFVCNIPVIVMGETGCGKTSLVKFFSNLHKRNFEKNLLHMKIHGGTTANEIETYLNDAEKLALNNFNQIPENDPLKHNPNYLITSILFFDEANTTEEIGLIKEILCDRTCNGRPIDLNHGLKIIAAVNPYRKHSNEMIEKLESVGLGFYISTSDTKERIGHIPMRQLVYRVQPLPTSLLPLVWDFGQLEASVEKVFISRLVVELIEPEHKYSPDKNADFVLIVDLLYKSQSFMRASNDECSFVSIRNIERIVKVTKWFVSLQNMLFPLMTNKKFEHINDYSYEQKLNPLRRSFVLALVVCYHASLYSNEKRIIYRKMVMDSFSKLDDDSKIETTIDWVFLEMLKCQSVFFDEIDLNKRNIACNLALFENVFMMIVCIELRIPLFIVGKPGSSKSLAKTIVSRAMEGRNSKSTLFQNLKETYFVNFQCSPLTTSNMILQAFVEAAKFQESVDINRSVAVVNLDEIGLAEGSESMPLKVLHPLLETGTDLHESETASDHNRVAVIGISNWALDPAKMNRGLFVSRGEPDINELISTAIGICGYDRSVLECLEPYIEKIAQGYLQLCEMAREFKREFFGLRDYYSLIKMIFYFCSRDRVLTWQKLEHAIKRNFGGLEIDNLSPFRNLLYPILSHKVSESDPKCDPLSLVESALKEEYVESNSRYLLFLTENNTAIDIVFNYLTQTVGLSPNNLSIIFGSSFRLDQQYTEVCRNISLIKHSMEIGKTIILLNSYNLYESLYDALNQYYYEFAGQKYVDLGLGTHRIKCSVHENFRLVIIADKEAVYDSKKFPIPLINRLEKHFLNASTILDEEQKKIVDEIVNWVNEVKVNFFGYHSDAVAGIVLHLSKRGLNKEELVNKAKKILIQCATPDSIVKQKDEFFWNEYFYRQKHLSLGETLDYHLNEIDSIDKTNLIQITSFSKSTILNLNAECLRNQLKVDYIDACLLQSFDTQHQFVTKLKQFYLQACNKGVLMVQADLSTANWDLISCARHHITEVYKSQKSPPNFFVILIILVEREVKNFVGFQLNQWSCYHVDEIDDPSDDLPDLDSLKHKSLAQILEENLNDDLKMEEKMEIADEKLFSLSSLFKKLSHIACSLIVDTNLIRNINRIDLFIKLCDNKPFVNILAKRLIYLQKEKEKNYSKKSSWLNDIMYKRDMSEFSTLRKSCQNYLSSKLSPLLGFLISKIDMYSNLDILFESLSENLEWRAGLWLKIFDDDSLLKIDYADMRSVEDGYSEELHTFSCQSDFTKKSLYQKMTDDLRPSLPFFWLLINRLNSLHSYLQNSSNVSNQIEMIPLYQLLDNFAQMFNNDPNFSIQILEYYIKDFLLSNLEIPNKICLNILEKGYFLLLTERGHSLSNGFAMVHRQYDPIRHKLEFFCKFLNFDQQLDLQTYETKEEYLNLDLDVAISSIQSLKRNFNIKKNMDSIDQLYDLIQLIVELLSKEKQTIKRSEKIRIIEEQYQSLVVLRYFSDLIRKFSHEFERLKDENMPLLAKIFDIFNHQLSQLNYVYFKDQIDFKHRRSLELLHSFIIECFYSLKMVVNDYQEVKEKLEEYLNTFYIDIIDNLCFEVKSSKRPDKELITFILKVLTDKKLVSSDKTFDINFSHRSLIIQIIFKNYDEIVCQHLTSWFQNDSFLGQQAELFHSAEEISILFQNCVVDHLINECIDYSTDKLLSEANKLCIEIIDKKETLKRIMGEKKIRLQTFNIEYLVILSKFKFCVNIFTRYIYSEEAFKSIRNEIEFENFNKNMKDIIEYTYYNLNPKTSTLINYLIKDLIRKYGSSSIKYVLSNQLLNWMTPNELIGSDDTITDRYVLLGEEYLTIKKAILDSFSVKNFNPLLEIINENNKKEYQTYVCIALYQNVTLLFKNLTTLTTNISDIFKPFIDSYYPDDKNLFDALLNNKFSNLFKINEENWTQIDLCLLLVQLKYSLLYSKSRLIEPLREFLINPSQICNFYVPTMPQDNLFDIKIAMKEHGGTNKFYSCPNGHIYVIGDCGRPWTKDKCKTCGEEIGGLSHKLVDNNQFIDENIQDKTLKGYCIQELSEQTENIRLMNSTSFYYERFIVNSCMYLAIGDNDENSNYVRQALSHQEPDLKKFFLSQMKNDLRLLANEMNLNMDELFLLLHLSFKNFLTKTDNNNWDFMTKEMRMNWENDFYNLFFKNIVQNSSQFVTDSNKFMQEINENITNSDKNQSKLYFMAYELLNIDSSKAHFMYESENFWKYRPNISYELMVKEFNKSNENKQKYIILNKFNEINHQLKMLPNLSEMIKLIHFFIENYNKSIFKDKARNMSIGNFISSISLPKEYSFNQLQTSIAAFQNTWTFIQPKIDEYIRINISNHTNLPVSFTHKFDMNTKLSYFLPTLNGDGFLPFVLIHYLSKIQNEMLDQSEKKIKNILIKPTYLFQNGNFLITFDPSSDLLRIIQSNFSYDSKNLKFIFRYDSIENQILDKYLRSKPKIDLNSILLFEYSDEINNFNIFKRLSDQNMQESLSLAEQSEILEQFKSIGEISEALNTLKITINYVIATSPSSNESIEDFLKKIYSNHLLKHSESSLKSKIIEYCKIKHLKIIWILLMTKKSIIQTLNNQDPFENLKSDFKKEFSQNIEFNFDKTFLISTTLLIYQIIAFVLSGMEGEEMQSYNQIPIRDMFISLESLEPLVMQDNYKIPEILITSEVSSIKMDSIYSIWKQLCLRWS